MGRDLKGREIGNGISQRFNGSYIARYFDASGKRRTFYGRDLKEVKRKLEKIRYEQEHGLHGNGDSITLEEWFEEFLKLYKEGKMKATTVQRIRQTFAPCKRRPIALMKLNQIRGIHIQEMINELYEKEDFKRSTLELLKSLLNEMFKRAVGNNFILINPCDSVVLPRKEKRESRFLNEKEQRMFLESAKGYAHENIFLANLTIGCRIGELLGLKWSDISWENKTIHIQRTLHYSRLTDNEPCHFFFTTVKTEMSDRVIPMLPETEKILLRVRNQQLQNMKLYASEWNQKEPFEDMVFTTQKGVPIRYGDVNRTIKKVVHKANLLEEEIAKFENRQPQYIEPFSPHAFRHTFITNALKNHFVEYDTVRLYVGHSQKEMTQYYNHNKAEIDVEALKRISFIKVE